MKHRILASAALAALGAPVLAQGITDLEEITVSGSLAPVPQAQSGATVEVLDSADIAGADSSIARTLSRLPGVSVSSNGGPGATTTLRLRGLDTSYIGVRVDGIDVTDPSSTQTAYNFGGLSYGGLGRVEVLKGSQSALYGSEAIGGVVDISTWRPAVDGLSGQASAEIGSFGSAGAALSLGHRTERGEVALSLSRSVTDGISQRAGDPERDSYRETFGSLSLRHAVGEAVTLGGTLFWRDSTLEYDQSATDPAGVIDSTQRGARVFAEIDAFGIAHTFSYSRFDTVRDDPAGFITRFEGAREQLSYLGNASLSAAADLSFGLDHTREGFDTSFDSGRADTTSAFAELRLRPRDGLDLSLALRHDEHSEFGGALTGRAAAVWRLQNDLTLRAVLGTGFRAPSLFERFSIYGSTALRPEQSRSAELGLEKGFANGATVKATAFYTEIDDLIRFDGASTACASGFGCYAQVPGTTRTRGLELSGSLPLNDWLSLSGNYTLTDARSEGARLARVPRHDLALGLDADLGQGWRAGLDIQRVADVEPSVFAPAANKVGSYTLVNLSVAYALSDRAEAYLRVENLFDEDYETAGGFNQPGRAAFFGLRASF